MNLKQLCKQLSPQNNFFLLLVFNVKTEFLIHFMLNFYVSENIDLTFMMFRTTAVNHKIINDSMKRGLTALLIDEITKFKSML